MHIIKTQVTEKLAIEDYIYEIKNTGDTCNT